MSSNLGILLDKARYSATARAHRDGFAVGNFLAYVLQVFQSKRTRGTDLVCGMQLLVVPSPEDLFAREPEEPRTGMGGMSQAGAEAASTSGEAGPSVMGSAGRGSLEGGSGSGGRDGEGTEEQVAARKRQRGDSSLAGTVSREEDRENGVGGVEAPQLTRPLAAVPALSPAEQRLLRLLTDCPLLEGRDGGILSVNMFCQSPDLIPKVATVGDIIRFHRMKILCKKVPAESHQGERVQYTFQGVPKAGDRGCHYILLSADLDSGFEPYESSSRNFSPLSPQERRCVTLMRECLCAVNEEVEEVGRGIFMVASAADAGARPRAGAGVGSGAGGEEQAQAGGAGAASEQQALTHFCDARAGMFVDICCKVLHMDTGRCAPGLEGRFRSPLLFVWDGTDLPPCLPQPSLAPGLQPSLAPGLQTWKPVAHPWHSEQGRTAPDSPVPTEVGPHAVRPACWPCLGSVLPVVSRGPGGEEERDWASLWRHLHRHKARQAGQAGQQAFPSGVPEQGVGETERGRIAAEFRLDKHPLCVWHRQCLRNRVDQENSSSRTFDGDKEGLREEEPTCGCLGGRTLRGGHSEENVKGCFVCCRLCNVSDSPWVKLRNVQLVAVPAPGMQVREEGGHPGHEQGAGASGGGAPPFSAPLTSWVAIFDVSKSKVTPLVPGVSPAREWSLRLRPRLAMAERACALSIPQPMSDAVPFPSDRLQEMEHAWREALLQNDPTPRLLSCPADPYSRAQPFSTLAHAVTSRGKLPRTSRCLVRLVAIHPSPSEFLDQFFSPPRYEGEAGPSYSEAPQFPRLCFKLLLEDHTGQLVVSLFGRQLEVLLGCPKKRLWTPDLGQVAKALRKMEKLVEASGGLNSSNSNSNPTATAAAAAVATEAEAEATAAATAVPPHPGWWLEDGFNPAAPSLETFGGGSPEVIGREGGSQWEKRPGLLDCFVHWCFGETRDIQHVNLLNTILLGGLL